MPRKLTEKQKLFCEHYAVSFNASDAARKAGYSKGSVAEGYRMLRNENISQYLDELLADRRDAIKLDEAWLVSNMLELHKAALAEEDFNTASKMLSALQKYLGLDRSQVDITGDGLAINIVMPGEDSND